MKQIRSAIFWGMGLTLFLVLLGGCQTGPFARQAAVEQTVDGAPALVFDEVLELLTEADYRIRTSNPSAGRIEALSALQLSSMSEGSMQRRIRVVVSEEAPGRSSVAVKATLLEEDRIPVHGQATFERAMPAHFYTAFFEELTLRLEEVTDAGD